ncbi:hypothetical protein J2W51_003149 [Tardiphaga robiniae]|uniref:hypothetical protein n=1 Tax=Tardiphaga robiniae TaxID=943830 RepID=UPI002858BA4B|nr:hypothetical protein [Tardiphaga robiniae]MDR6660579.1 hypothetical protein [Tardiphaga robiniae]
MNTQDIVESARALQADLIGFSPRLSRVVPDFSSRFAPLLKAYPRPFLVKKFKNDSAFTVTPRQLSFNLASVRLFHEPIDKMEHRKLMPPDIADIARHIAIEQLIVHEMTHLSVGLIRFDEVQTFKRLVGVNALGELDLIADATAARVCARLEMYRAQEKGTPNYASRLLQQIYVMGDFALPAFGAPPDKLHKRQRFLGLAMMAARLHDFLERGGRYLAASEYPIDTPLYPYVDIDAGVVMISAFNPDRTLWGTTANVDASLLKTACDNLEKVAFAETVNHARQLLNQIGVLQSPALQALSPNSKIELAVG